MSTDMRVRIERTAGVAAFVVVFFLWTIPPATLEHWPSICLVRYIFGIDCPGCGMTRALSLALHGDFSGAAENNSMIVAVAPLLFFIFIRGLAAWSRPSRTTARCGEVGGTGGGSQ